MALGSDVKAQVEYDSGQPTFPASVSSGWKTVIDAGGMDAQDGTVPGTVVNPTTDITASDHHKFTRQVKEGTNIVLCLAYDALANVTTPGTVVVFGRKDSNDPWVLLRTRSGALSLSFTCASTDASDGTLKYTTPYIASEAIDTLGCNEFMFGVTIAHAVSSGSAALAKLLAKVI